jgi:hypothetical protein
MADNFIRRIRKKFGAMQGAFMHTKERAKERGSVDLQPSDYVKAVRAISTGQVDFDKDLGPGRFEAAVKMRGRNLRVVYDADAKLIVTVLPTELKHDRTAGEAPVKAELDLSKRQRAKRHDLLKKNKLRKRAETKLLHKLIK